MYRCLKVEAENWNGVKTYTSTKCNKLVYLCIYKKNLYLWSNNYIHVKHHNEANETDTGTKLVWRSLSVRNSWMQQALYWLFIPERRSVHEQPEVGVSQSMCAGKNTRGAKSTVSINLQWLKIKTTTRTEKQHMSERARWKRVWYQWEKICWAQQISGRLRTEERGWSFEECNQSYVPRYACTSGVLLPLVLDNRFIMCWAWPTFNSNRAHHKLTWLWSTIFKMISMVMFINDYDHQWL